MAHNDLPDEQQRVLAVYLPPDRRMALSKQQPLPIATHGAALFVDISGFTQLTDVLTRHLGMSQGAEELSIYLNAIYNALIEVIETFGGSVVCFSGDAVTCWFSADAPDDGALPRACLLAVAAALAVQRAIQRFEVVSVAGGEIVLIAIKASVAAGQAQRLLVGDPAVQLFDVVAGSTIDRMASGEQLAQKGEVLVAPEVVTLIGEQLEISGWRTNDEGQRFALVVGLQQAVGAVPKHIVHKPLGLAQVRQWMPSQVYERLTTGQDAFLAELRSIVALFVSFAGLEYDTDTNAQDRLDQFIRWVQHLLARYDGTLLQLTIGDKGSYLYIVFGAPVTHEDDPLRALMFALTLRMLPPELDWVTELRIGISQGPLRIGAYGSTTRRTYGALGDDVNLAARLMSMAQAQQVLVTGRIMRTAEDQFVFTDLGEHVLKGKSEPMRIFALEGQQRQQPYTNMTPRNRNTNGVMVGREREQALLRERLLELHTNDQGGVVIIEGEPGIGKSRLVAELRAAAHALGITSFVGAASAIEQATLYFSWREIFAQLLDLNVLIDPVARRQHLTDLLEEEPELLQLAPLLNTVLLLEMPDNQTTAALAGKLRADTTRELLMSFLSASTRRSPKILILEDTHWLDSASWALAFEATQVSRQLLIITTRPLAPPEADSLSLLLTHPATLHIKLEPLSLAETLTLVEQRLGITQLPPDGIELFRERSQGNPFFTEELAYTLRDSGALVIEEQDCRLAPGVTDLQAFGFPVTLQTAIIGRIDRLLPTQQLVLKVASVIGRVFAWRILAAIYPIAGNHADLAERVADLERSGLLLIESPEPELAYSFKHVITQDVAYNLMLFAQRRHLHEEIALWYEYHYLDDLAPYYALLAHHWRSAGDAQRAIIYFRQAGEQAMRDGAHQEATRFLQAAAELQLT
jgi:class 3 adenylate cyclase